MSNASPPCSQQQEALSASAASSVVPVAGVAAACNHSTALTVASTESAAVHAAPKETVEKVAADGIRISKIKVALVIGYNGSRFGGLQRNPGQFAIEDVLEEAVYIDPLYTRMPHHSLTLVPVIKPGASRRATIETFTKSAGQGRLEPTKACMPRATSCHSRCLRHASSLTTDQQLAPPLFFSSIICGVCCHGLLYQRSLIVIVSPSRTLPPLAPQFVPISLPTSLFSARLAKSPTHSTPRTLRQLVATSTFFPPTCSPVRSHPCRRVTPPLPSLMPQPCHRLLLRMTKRTWEVHPPSFAAVPRF